MNVYIFREGYSNRFKIGETLSPDVDSRRRHLNTGSGLGLRLFEKISTDLPKKMQDFLHKLLAHRKVNTGGGEEFFEMKSDDHMREFLKRAAPMFQTYQAAINDIDSFEQIQSTDQMLIPKQEDLELRAKLREVQFRIREAEDEIIFLKCEAEMIQAKLESRIGNDLGITGVAVWEPTLGNRRFCEAKFIENEPELYAAVLQRFSKPDIKMWKGQEPDLYREISNRFPSLDTSAWRLGDKRLYKEAKNTYFTAKVTRNFMLLDT